MVKKRLPTNYIFFNSRHPSQENNAAGAMNIQSLMNVKITNPRAIRENATLR